MGIGIRKVIGKFNEAVMARKSRESIREAHTKKRISTLLNNQSDFATIEAYKAIRTNINFTLGVDSNECKKLIITSAIPATTYPPNAVIFCVTPELQIPTITVNQIKAITPII